MARKAAGAGQGGVPKLFSKRVRIDTKVDADDDSGHGKQHWAPSGPEVRVGEDICPEAVVRALVDHCIVPALVNKFLREKGIISDDAAAPHGDRE
jgi:hypothetical protein